MNQTLPTVFIFGVLFAISASPQETAVAELSKEDSTKASELYKRLKAAEQEWAGFKDSVQQKYGPALAKTLPRDRITSVQRAGGHELFVVPSEWSGGIEFSTDFRFVVPTPRR